jgi:hypothetical protein
MEKCIGGFKNLSGDKSSFSHFSFLNIGTPNCVGMGHSRLTVPLWHLKDLQIMLTEERNLFLN